VDINEWLTAGVADLHPGLTDVYRDDFTHRPLRENQSADSAAAHFDSDGGHSR
jgi:hypothetical protein